MAQKAAAEKAAANKAAADKLAALARAAAEKAAGEAKQILEMNVERIFNKIITSSSQSKIELYKPSTLLFYSYGIGGLALALGCLSLYEFVPVPDRDIIQIGLVQEELRDLSAILPTILEAALRVPEGCCKRGSLSKDENMSGPKVKSRCKRAWSHDR